MTSPFLIHEAKRLRIAARLPSPPVSRPPKLIVSAHAEYRASDYRFARRQSDPAPLEKSRPITSTATRLARALVIAFIFASLWAATSGLAWLLTSD